tara:strand:- start:91 stop:1155 length:1065 start_codon:yes stop_codon:yes gene_type:complete
MFNFKNYLTEGSLKAEDYEAAIVVGFHKITGQKFDVEKSGVGAKTMSVLENNPAALEAGEKIAIAVKKHFKLGNVKAEQYGRAKSSLTGEWKKYGATDTTPKTDILIGNKRLSLKIGMAQLMSGGKSESLATFYAATNSVSNEIKSDPNYKLTESIVNDFVTASVAPSQLRPLIKSGENELVNKGEKAHKAAMSAMTKLFANNRDFKIAFAREAMSGFVKYGSNSNSAAEFMLVSTHDGRSVSIHSVYDDKYCEKIADAMKVQVRFKTSSRKLKGVKTGEYNFWSVVSLIVNAMSEGSHPTNEMINENIFNKIKNKVKGVYKNILSRVKKSVLNLVSFLTPEKPDVRVNTKVKF